MSLTQQLKEKAALSVNKHPENIREVMNKAIQELADSQLIPKALKTGDTIPKIILPNASNKLVSVQELLLDNKVILSFYRGGWCPYCNLELRALQNSQEKFKKLGAILVAISPETPDNSLSTLEKNNLSFEILSDVDNVISSAFNLTFTLPKDLVEIYNNFGINLEQSNGNKKNQLPIAATYIIDQNGTIIYDFIKEDYKERADPDKIIKNLTK
ncbi:peroxiredoxin-like family protein [Aquimarina addita]|uniref:thioredoxin-dependent peroxiredoxin n=1 Tax=Aquimarina addita TaxID=870485 RepID=A0ABP7XH77_9FLAO